MDGDILFGTYMCSVLRMIVSIKSKMHKDEAGLDKWQVGVDQQQWLSAIQQHQVTVQALLHVQSQGECAAEQRLDKQSLANWSWLTTLHNCMGTFI